jgi:predicted RecA/RadA family phage recombinase
MAKFVQEGRYLDYTPVADTSAGTEVVVEDTFGVVPSDLAANQLGAIDTEGVWEVTKIAGAATTDGKKAYRKDDGSGWQESATDSTLRGVFVGDQLSADTTCKVRLTPNVH